MKSIRVNFYLNITPHYRKEILLKLAESTKTNNHIYAGQNGIESIKKLDKHELTKAQCNQFHDLENVFFGKYLIWQKGVVKTILFGNINVAIFTGEITVLSTWLAFFICKIRKIETGIWGHGLYGNEGSLLKIIRLFYHQLCDHNFVYGHHSEDLLIQSGIKPETIAVIYNSLDLENAQKIYKKLVVLSDHSRTSKKKLLFIGRLTKVKRLDLLIEALYLLVEKDKTYELTIVGEGEEKDSLLQLIYNYNLDQYVFWKGALYENTDVALIIYNSDLLVSPGNVGLNAIQSLMYGTPVCTHDDTTSQMPEYEAISVGKSGISFKKNDISSLILAIQDWFYGAQMKSPTEIQEACREVILRSYNSTYQFELFTQRFLQTAIDKR